jgi:hypothetical protein
VPRKKSNPDIRTGLKGDPSHWTPLRVYPFLCRCFRRPAGELALTEQEYRVARGEYTSRAIKAYFFSPKGKPGKTQQRRRYIREQRGGVLDDTPTRILEIIRSFHEEEFAEIIIQGESNALRSRNIDEAALRGIVCQRYSYLPQVNEARARAETPYSLALAKVASKLGIKEESLRRMLAPSYRRRAGTPTWLSALSPRPSKEMAREAIRKARMAWAGFKGKI